MNHVFRTNGDQLAHPTCDRVTCSDPVGAFLLFDPRETAAWLRDYDISSRTVGIGLCHPHADGVTVPNGWDMNDERGPASERKLLAPVPEPVSAEAPVEEIVVEPAAAAPEAALDLEVDEFEPTLWAESDPTPLRADKSTPLLNRAFRAAHIE